MTTIFQQVKQQVPDIPAGERFDAQQEAVRRTREIAGISALPEEAQALEAVQAERLATGFRRAFDESESCVERVRDFSLVGLYAIGTEADLGADSVAKQLLLSLCTTARRRPVPLLRWSEYVLDNIAKLDKVRGALQACYLSQRELDDLLANVGAEMSGMAGLPQRPRILLVGFSQHALSVLEGLAAALPGPARITTSRVRVREALEGKRNVQVDLVREDELKQALAPGAFDLAVSGCNAIGRFEGRLEIVNGRQSVGLAKAVKRMGVPVAIAGALYKIWPAAFYEKHRAWAELETVNGEPANGFLRSWEVDWILTEYGCSKASQFGRAILPKALLERDVFELPMGLSARGDERFRYYTEEIQKKGAIQLLQELAEEEPKGPGVTPVIDPERLEWRKTGKLPKHYEEGAERFKALLADDAWYKQHEGRYVAVPAPSAPEPSVIGPTDDLSELLRQVQEQQGDGLIYIGVVAREPRTARLW